jgi:hypothetical protein
MTPVNAACKNILRLREDRTRAQARKQDDLATIESTLAEARDSTERLVRESRLNEIGSNPSAMYELCGRFLHGLHC